MHARCELTVAYAQYRSMEARHSRGRRGVPDVALDRTQRAVTAAAGPFAEYRSESLKLHRIAELRARAMRLDITDSIGVYREAIVNIPQKLSLRAHARCGDSIRPAVLIRAGSDDDRKNLVTVCLCVA